ncbi:MAG TPA: hypothetical protein PLE13_06440 [Solirubrobacterales bacterium]|nr:hypothetical protein [Solirubrobacterales bacterium]HNE77418.1 hypothetical protein [Solirubrobacterales bacterium]HNF83608.1 hypothetical protein [Solirubrobacterales bacterium]HNK35138.1 hypothetical protein [Solirubrobacterales bacterium]HNK66623.1 hypothetical protein [Solirubrobacterales bacterium]
MERITSRLSVAREFRLTIAKDLSDPENHSDRIGREFLVGNPDHQVSASFEKELPFHIELLAERIAVEFVPVQFQNHSEPAPEAVNLPAQHLHIHFRHRQLVFHPDQQEPALEYRPDPPKFRNPEGKQGTKFGCAVPVRDFPVAVLKIRFPKKPKPASFEESESQFLLGGPGSELDKCQCWGNQSDTVPFPGFVGTEAATNDAHHGSAKSR